MSALESLLRDAIDPAPVVDLADFWRRHDAIARPTAAIARALVGGLRADRLGYAFAAGYQAALRVLVPALAEDAKACLCATEAGGAHPSAIATALVPDPSEPGAFRLSGHKRWASIADARVVLLVVATTGVDPLGRAQLRVAKVPSDAPGVRLEAMPTPPFAPEIGHFQVHFEDVRVAAHEVLGGDGYSQILKPFRTIEDVHVTAAVLGYVVREVRLHALDRSLAERAIALVAALEGIARMDASAAATHVALAGMLALERALLPEFEAAWAPKAPDAHARFVRDRPLLGVAGSARSKRLARAWERLAEA